MAIADKDIKLLWGRAAGCCSAPDCHIDLTPLVIKSGIVVIGEMAHVIGRKRGAARSQIAVGEDNTYDNLILLCPNHHTLVDKAKADYPVELLQKWKNDWEDQRASITLKINTRKELFQEISKRLTENHTAFVEWGPTSSRAKESPQSCQAASIWQLRRLGVIVPNNRSIVAILKNSHKLLSPEEWRLASIFIEHAEFYEGHCVDPKDATAYFPFPPAFANFIFHEVNNG